MHFLRFLPQKVANNVLFATILPYPADPKLFI